MPTVTRSDLVIPEVLADAVAGAWPNRIALLGTNAVVESRTLPGGVRGGDRVKVPYFGVIGEFQRVQEGEALTPVDLQMTADQVPVVRAGNLVELTTFAEIAAFFARPREEIVNQLIEGARRLFDEALIEAAADPNGPGVATHDASQGPITYEALVRAKGLFGDSVYDVAALAVHSEVHTAMHLIRDGDGRPLLLASATEGGLDRVLGIPVIVSDRLPRIQGNPPRYVSLLIRRNALALWYNGLLSVEIDRDIARDTYLFAVNVYYAVHRFRRLPGSAAPTVVRLVTQ